MKTLMFQIEGMRCEGCADTVKALLSVQDGVQVASVSWSDGTARVLIDPGKARPEQLVAAIERAGYQASLPAS